MAKPTSVYPLKITLEGIKPPLWRRVEVADCTLSKLNDIIQLCFGWGSCHLWCFEIKGEQYSDDTEGDMDYGPARQVKLSQLVQERVKKFRYVYDFGDNWDHLIQIEKVVEADPKAKYPRCVAGERAGPPEDCGGPWGYADLLEAIRNPDHPEHEDMLEWVGGEFDPEAFDLKGLNQALARLR